MGSSDTQIDFLIRQYRLTRREIEVVDLIVTGQSNKQAAYFLSISPRTVEVYRARVFAKLRVNNVASLALKVGALTVHFPLAFPMATASLPIADASANPAEQCDHAPLPQIMHGTP